MSDHIIDTPGVYDIPDHVYHADPIRGGSMSSTQARHILTPGCPALVEYERTHHEHKDAWDLGTVVHKLVLGKGTQVVEIGADTWRGKATEHRTQTRTEGHVALLSKDMRTAEAMRDAVHAHPIAGPLFAPGTFLPERSIFWEDKGTGIWRRAMIDHMRPDAPRPIIVDLKTTQNASPDHIRRAVADFGYHIQQAWYTDGFESWFGDDQDLIFLFVFIQSKAPHLVTVVELDHDAVQAGHHAARTAINTYAHCQKIGEWPGHDEKRIHTITLPPWATRNEDTP